jgi:hypothetical protein
MNLTMDHVGRSSTSSDDAVRTAAAKASEHHTVEVLETWYDAGSGTWHALVSERVLPERHR